MYTRAAAAIANILYYLGRMSWNVSVFVSLPSARWVNTGETDTAVSA